MLNMIRFYIEVVKLSWGHGPNRSARNLEPRADVWSPAWCDVWEDCSRHHDGFLEGLRADTVAATRSPQTLLSCPEIEYMNISLSSDQVITVLWAYPTSGSSFTTNLGLVSPSQGVTGDIRQSLQGRRPQDVLWLYAKYRYYVSTCFD